MADVTIRVDRTLKNETDKIFRELGLSPSVATTVFYKQVVRCGGIPFELRTGTPSDAKNDTLDPNKSSS